MSMVRFSPILFATTGIVVAAASPARAHTLPISQLALVADGEYLHAEITINAEELVFFASLDENSDGRLDRTELDGNGSATASAVFAALSFRVAEKELSPEVVGVVPGGDGHHATLRAHYALAARNPTVVVTSKLDRVTRGAHATQATFQAGGRREAAVLDARTPQVTFNRRAASSPTRLAIEPAASNRPAAGAGETPLRLGPAAGAAALAAFAAGVVLMLRRRLLGQESR